MKRIAIFATLAAAVALTVACNGKSAKVEEDEEDEELELELKTDLDSLSYAFGILLANDFQNSKYMEMNGVDSTMTEPFIQGINETSGLGKNKKEDARLHGLALGLQLINMVKTNNSHFFGENATKSLDKEEVANTLLSGLHGTGNMTKDEADSIINNFNADNGDVKSLSRAVGTMLGGQLKEFDVLSQYGVEEREWDDCIEGMKEALLMEDDDQEGKARILGIQAGRDIRTGMIKNFAQSVLPDGDAKKLSEAIVIDAFTKKINGDEILMTKEEAQKLLEDFQTRMIEKQQEEQAQEFSDNKAQGEAFLESNKEKPGVVTTASGLQFKIIEQGRGARPTANDRVKVHYEGRLIDGTVFDSSIERGEPAVFGVTQVIAGWQEALQLMPVGSEWELYIPQELAYGNRNAGTIQPYSTLIFKVKLLGIE